MKILYNCLNIGQSWFFPAACLLCTQPIQSQQDFCYGCERSLPRLGTTCPRCAGAISKSTKPCGRCQKQPPAYTRTLALFSYAPPIDRLIQGLKYGDQLNNARVLGELMAAKAESIRSRPDVIMPVPLHRRRLRERGYNQSLELARPIARRLALPLDYRSVKRVRATLPQTGLSLRERARNVRNAFAVTRPVAGLHIALVDDVVTTGHTINSLALCLRKAGASQIDVWVAARA